MVDTGERASTAQPAVTPLPSFDSPPVIEVVCGVQFAPLQGFTSIHHGLFFELVRGMYPRTLDRTPIADLFEPLKPTGPITETIDIPPLRRVFYIDESGNFLLQLQSSRFLANWRKMRATDQYPRFPAPYGRFLDGWDTFLRFTEAHNIGRPQVNQYELTYINHLEAFDRPFPQAVEQLIRTFSWTTTRSTGFLPFPGSVSIRNRFPLPQDSGSLHLTIDLGRRNRDQAEVLVVDFTARGPGLPDASNMRAWFEIAHEWVVRGFTDLTSPEAHRHWGRRE